MLDGPRSVPKLPNQWIDFWWFKAPARALVFFVFNCRLVQIEFGTTEITARGPGQRPAPARRGNLVEIERARNLGVVCVLCDVLSRCLKTFDTLWDGFGGGG
jgi:hypothetical protein